jgi:MFS transporter, FHS family, L-fucose permease
MQLYDSLQKNFKQKVGIFDLFTLGLLFFIWGFLTQMNDILLPRLYDFGLNYSEALMLNFTFFTTYLIISYPAAKFIDKFGYKSGIIFGLLLSAIGCLGFYYGMGDMHFITLLFSLFIVACGITFLQIAGNGYVVLQSTPRKAASNLTFAQSLNSLGRIVTIIFGAYLIYVLSDIPQESLALLSPTDYMKAESSAFKTPYLLMAGLIVVTGVLFYTSKLPEYKTEGMPVLVKMDSSNINNLFKIKHLLFASIAIFAYVGAEVSIGTNLVTYLTLPNVGGSIIDEKKAIEMLQYYWGSAMIGRLIGGFIMRDLSPRKVIAGFAGAAAFFTLVSIFSTGNISVVSIVAVGFFNSILFPAIFTLGINGLGHFAEEGSAVLISSIVGGAIIPLVVITLADFVGLQYAFLVATACYAYIVYFGFIGSEFEKNKNTT